MPEIAEDEFVRRFQPEAWPNGDLYRQRDWTEPEDWAAVVAAHAERRVWTQVDGDNGEWCLIPGIHYVNRNYYVICAVSCDDESLFVVDNDMPSDDEDEEQNNE